MYYLFYLFLHLFSYLCLNAFATCVSNAYDLLGFVAAPLLYLHCISFSVKIYDRQYLSILYLYMQLFFRFPRAFFNENMGPAFVSPAGSACSFFHDPKVVRKPRNWVVQQKKSQKITDDGQRGTLGDLLGTKKPTTTWENISVK